MIGGSTKSPDLFVAGDSLASGSLGFPIFQYYDSTNCAFLWSLYINRNLESVNVQVALRSDFNSIAVAFNSQSNVINIGILSLAGSLTRLISATYPVNGFMVYKPLYD